MAKPNGRAIPPERLRATFDPATLTFECTDELAPLTELVGQARGIRALEFGLGLNKPGYNIFVTGLSGTGKTSAILEYIQRQSQLANKHDVRDWIYVYNFDDPDAPNAISVAKGVGRLLRNRLEELLKSIRGNIAQAFSSEEYSEQRRDTFEEGQRKAQAIMEEAQRRAEAAGFQLSFTPSGPVLLPLKDGRTMTAEEFQALSIDEKHALAERQRPVEQSVEEAGEQLRTVERQVSETIQNTDRAVVEAVVKAPFDTVGREFLEYEDVGVFISQLLEHTLKSADMLRQMAAAPTPQSDAPAPPMIAPLDPFLAFRINLFVDNADVKGPPIVVEQNPSWTNLFGRIDRRAYLGTYLSDHTMLKAGTAHRANGGYLILSWNDVATRMAAWDGVKRMIRTSQIRLEDPVEQYGFLTPQTLRPEPIPIDMKVIIAGDAMPYIMLSMYDEEFWELFKVKADFDYAIDRTPDNVEAYAGFACAVCEREKLHHFDRSAVASLIEYGSRAVEDQQKLSARFGRIRDLIIEADYWANTEGDDRVQARHVEQAIAERVYRSNLVEERLRELIARGTFLISTGGDVVGQVNGLAVLDFGDLRFGRPTRITARTYLGQRGVISIDRESQLSGKIHDKGVLILSGYLGSTYGQSHPLSLSATISFEQGYDTIDGDSASLAETCAIVSSLAAAPIRQDLAITGSVNQKGEVQAIGGANAKIEGFFDVCKTIGLTGKQGVVLPSSNVQNLMLRSDVVQAVREGRFAIYEVASVDEALEVLTGVPTGERQANGTYPDGSIHARVLARLDQMGEAIRQSGAGASTQSIALHQPADTGKPPEPPAPPRN